MARRRRIYTAPAEDLVRDKARDQETAKKRIRRYMNLVTAIIILTAATGGWIVSSSWSDALDRNPIASTMSPFVGAMIEPVVALIGAVCAFLACHNRE